MTDAHPEYQVADATAPTPDVMTVEELAEYLKVSRRSVYNMAKAGEIPAVKVVGQWRFYRPVIDRWLEEGSLLHAKVRFGM